MARIQVYLPDDLFKQLKAHGLPASELLQKAVRAELRRLDLLNETDRYIADLVAEVGPPTAAQRTRAATVARRLARRPRLGSRLAARFTRVGLTKDIPELREQPAQPADFKP